MENRYEDKGLVTLSKDAENLAGLGVTVDRGSGQAHVTKGLIVQAL